LPPRPVAADTESVEVRIPDKLTTVAQGSVAPETATRAASPEIQEVEKAGASLSQGVAGDEARTLELACVLWAASSRLGADSEDDEEATAPNTLERGMTWARRTFNEFILPATSVSFLVRGVASQSRDLLGLRHLSLSCRLQVLESFGRRRACEVRKLRTERTQLEMQLVMAQVVAAGAVAIEASTRASLEAARASAEDRAIAVETATATAAAERHSLASKLAHAKAEVERLRAAAGSVEEAAERAKTAAATVEATARDTAEAATPEKTALETKMSELESDLRTATTDLATTSRQFSQVANQFQVATEEVSRLQDSNAKLSQELDGTLGDPSALD
jgi:hypothetical protein